MDRLMLERELIAVDLPGFGATPALPGKPSIAAIADALTDYLRANGLIGVDAVGSSMGGRLVLELARRGGVVGAVVALAPGGFWNPWERRLFHRSIGLSVRLLRFLEPQLPQILETPAGRSLLMAQLSAHPWKLSPRTAIEELQGYARSPFFDATLRELVRGERQQGAARGTIAHPVVIAWGRRDRVCFPRQARRALQLFPDAELHWFERCGHFPQWDVPRQTARLILNATRSTPVSSARESLRG